MRVLKQSRPVASPRKELTLGQRRAAEKNWVLALGERVELSAPLHWAVQPRQPPEMVTRISWLCSIEPLPGCSKRLLRLHSLLH